MNEPKPKSEDETSFVKLGDVVAAIIKKIEPKKKDDA